MILQWEGCHQCQPIVSIVKKSQLMQNENDGELVGLEGMDGKDSSFCSDLSRRLPLK